MKHALSFLSLLLTFSLISQDPFDTKVNVSTTVDGSYSVFSADLDGDGLEDIISGSSLDSQVSWFKNLGGSFGPRVTIANIESRSVYSCDIDNDGDNDIVSASSPDNSIVWLENTGGGSFNSPHLVSDNIDGVQVAKCLDADSDGDQDLFVASYTGNKFSMFFNDGQGGFGSEVIIATGTDGASDIEFGDMDGDGDVDLITVESLNNRIRWLENDGLGFFNNPEVIATNVFNATCAAPLDMDNDGDLDVVYSGTQTQRVYYSKNLDGLGNFGANLNVYFFGTNDSVRSLVTGDFDSDGWEDIVTIFSASNEVRFFKNSGNDTFGNYYFGGVGNGYDIVTADFNNDNGLDLLCAGYNYDQVSYFMNNSPPTVYGCMNSEACNYNSLAQEEDGSCCFLDCGCIDPSAVNFDSSASCSDFSCNYKLVGRVYYDENENGFLDSDESGLPFRTVQIQELDVTLLTNSQGQFEYNFGQGQYTIILETDYLFPNSTTPNPLNFIVGDGWSSNLEFGVSDEYPISDICVDLYPSGNFICNDYSNHNICFRNLGNLTISGTVELEYDGLFQDFLEVTPIDSVESDKIYMSFENLTPGEMFMYDVQLQNPTTDFLDEYLESSVSVKGYYQGSLVSSGEQNLTTQVTCAYDPNDKQAFPSGYTEDHLILKETEVEYLVRFQNTGNAPAYNIHILDTIDTALDLSTFKMVANSHSVMVSINENSRLIDFYFQDINLPDSVNNEPDSHGLISYKITPYQELQAGTEVNNTAYIFFDLNEPIITNTTWHTIHECGGEADFLLSQTPSCYGQEINFSNSYPLIDSLKWFVNGDLISNQIQFDSVINVLGDYTIEHLVENELCIDSSYMNLELNNISDLYLCAGDFNCDGTLNTLDLSILLSSFGCEYDLCSVDSTGDGRATSSDLLQLISFFGNNCD